MSPLSLRNLTWTLLFACAPLWAADYFIDFANGDNAADGLSATSAWQHAPVDPQTTGNPAQTVLQPGDTLRFKGGVAYHGSLVLGTSGTEESPIRLNGNPDGRWGNGPAILDGGRVIEAWRPVESPEQVAHNPRWRKILVAEIEADIHPNVTHGDIVLHRKQKTERQAPWQRVFLIDGDAGLLPVAQLPKPKDPFFPDLPADFFKLPRPLDLGPNASRTRIHAADTFSGLTATALEGAFAGFHAGNNHTYFGPVLDYDPESGVLELPLYEGRTYDATQFALYNSPALISKPGEWAVTSLGPNRTQVFLLPPDPSSPPKNIAFPELTTGILIEDGASHFEIDGFLIKRYAGGEGGIAVARSKSRSSNITITNCEIRNLTGMAGVMLNYCDAITVRDTAIHHNPGWTVGIFLSRVNHYELTNNRLTKNAGSGIRHYECTQGRISGNRLIDHHGIHSSGMNLYTGSRDILVENNFLTDVITINRSAERVTLRNNIVDVRNRGGFCLAFWVSGKVGGRHIRDILVENNTFIRPVHNGVILQNREGVPEPEGLVFRNNVLAAISGTALPEGTVMKGNVLLGNLRFPLPPDNEIVPDLSKVLIDPEAGDYRRVPGGPLPEAGANPEAIPQ